MTKGTGLFYGIPIMLFLGIVLVQRIGIIKTFRPVLLITFISLLLSSGHFMRNIEEYGSPVFKGKQKDVTNVVNEAINYKTFLSRTYLKFVSGG